jgi:diguanylate cyclase (GGDEF)-like protein
MHEHPMTDYAAIARLAQRLLGVPVAFVFDADSEDPVLEPQPRADAPHVLRQLITGVSALAGDDGLFVLEDVRADARFKDHPLVSGEQGIRFIGGTTLTSPDGTPLGTFCIVDMAPRSLDEADRSVLHDIAEVVERELTARLLAAIDPLTGLRNRRSIELGGDLLLGMADRNRTVTAAVFIDADHFKRINDSHGHEAGDEALRELAAVLRDATRSSDVIGRLGGDEFAMILSNTDEAAAIEVVSRVHRLLALAARLAPRPYGLSVSAGIAVRPPGRGSLAELLAAADDALYQTKAGRTD